MGCDEARSQRLGLRVLMMLAVLLREVCQAHPIPDSSPLLQFGGQVRQRFLYTDDAQETEAHLEIRGDGTVVGAARRSPEGECKIGPSLREEGGAGGPDPWGWGRRGWGPGPLDLRETGPGQRSPESLTTFSSQVSWS